MRGRQAGHRRIPWGCVLAAGLAGVTASQPPALSQEMEWAPLVPGLAATVWEPGAHCHEEVPPLLMVKVDPEWFRFAVYHFRDEGLADPPTIEEWQRRTGASVVVNSGLFREDYSYLGLLLKDGRSLGSRRHGSWQGLFVAEPVRPGDKKAGILDLAMDPFAEDHPAYREAAQSLMLLDRKGKARVRRSGKQAYQTVLGEDGDGHILLIKTMEPAALWELADCLKNRVPTIRQAMAMDGGSSSDLLVRADLVAASREGRSRSGWREWLDGTGGRHIPLPSVIALFPRTDTPASPRP